MAELWYYVADCIYQAILMIKQFHKLTHSLIHIYMQTKSVNLHFKKKISQDLISPLYK